MTLTTSPLSTPLVAPEVAHPFPNLKMLSPPGVLWNSTFQSTLDNPTCQTLSRWIDLIRQAFQVPSPLTPSMIPGLTPRHLNVLDCMPPHGEWITLIQLARTLRITEPLATSLVAPLVVVGAVSCEWSATDRRLVRIAATTTGRQLVAQHRRCLMANLHEMLNQLPPAKFTVATIAMVQLAKLDWNGSPNFLAITPPIITLPAGTNHLQPHRLQ